MRNQMPDDFKAPENKNTALTQKFIGEISGQGLVDDPYDFDLDTFRTDFIQLTDDFQQQEQKNSQE